MKSILIVEDDRDIIELMKELLEDYYQEIDLAYNGMEALELYKQKNHDIILSDISMPLMDGIELSKKVIKINKEQKIILITADKDEIYQKQAKNLGISHILKKPIEFSELISIMK